MRRSARMRRVILPWLLLAAAAPAQAAPNPAPWRFDDVPGATATVVVLAFEHGFESDGDGECGLARVVAECRLRRVRVATSASDTGVLVLGDLTLLFGALPAGSASLSDFVGAALDRGAALSDDEIAVCIAQAALVADDAAWLYPGQVLETRARQRLFGDQPAGRPAAGRAEALQACTVARVRERLAETVAVRGHLLGARVQTELPVLPDMAAPPRPVAEAVHGDGSMSVAPHSRVDGPFVAAAFALPSGVGRRDLVLALEVARVRAARQLRLRGGEALARAPLVGWSWRTDEPLVILQRRGFDGDDPGPAQQELARFLDELRAAPPNERELRSAIGGLVAEIAMPPWDPALAKVLAGAPGALVGRALTVVLARRRGLDAVDFRGATAAEVHRAMQRVFAAEGSVWLALEPAPAVGPPGWVPPRR